MLEFEAYFERRSSFGDAGWAGHAVSDVQRHLRGHADIIIICDGVRRHTQTKDTSIQMPLAAYQHLTAEATQYAARLSESAVNTVLGQLLRSGELPTLGAVEVLLQLSETPPLEDVHIDEVELTAYDHLLDGEEEVVQC